ncbi:MAG: RNA-binding S4 domain-containing protein [Limnothrix sp.]
MIQGCVELNGEMEIRRKKKLRHDELISFEEEMVQVDFAQ